MTISAQSRLSDSPYVESIIQGHTLCADSRTRPAESNWYLVFAKHHKNTQIFLVGPWTASGPISYPAEAEILWLRFRLGTFMPHLHTPNFINTETSLPQGAFQSFWLNGEVWEFPDFENADTFVDKLVRREVIRHDPLVSTVLQDEPVDLSQRTVRHRFVQATGLTQSYIRQMNRAHHAAELLRDGVSILDTVFATGYYDQPHLTRSLKQFIGYTPAQIQPTCQST